METKDIPSNSFRSREENSITEKEPVRQVTSNAGVTKNVGQKLLESFIKEDAKDIFSYLVGDVIIPAVKDVVCDCATKGLNLLLYGEARVSKKHSNTYSSGGSTSYYSIYDDHRYKHSGYQYTRYHKPDISDIRIDDRESALEILSELDRSIKKYGWATVSEFYDTVGVTGDHTDCKFGWTDLSQARVCRTVDGKYYIDFPKPVQIAK